MSLTTNHLAQLERELRSQPYQELLERLQKEEPFFKRFAIWADVISFMRMGTSRDPLKDEVLRPIFRALAADQDHRWQTVLLAIFWPALESIHRKKSYWDSDPDELWANIYWTFLQVIHRVDVAKRPNRLVQKVYNDTVHHLHDEYRRSWNQQDRERARDPRELEELDGGVEDIGFAMVEGRDEQEAEIKRLRAHAEQGRISEADFLLLVGTRVYGSSVAEYAREAGLDYQVAKKRRQRAEATIRRFEEEQKS